MVTIKKKKCNIVLNETGFASIVIALILIVVMALLTVAFAQLARREQQNALTKQLANQAYYAAESGINDAVTGIQAGTLNSSTPDINTNKCITAAPLDKGKVNVNNGVSYTCVIVNLQPDNLFYPGISPGSARSATFSTTGKLNRFTVTWSHAQNDPAPAKILRAAGTKDFSPNSSWQAPAVIQLSITPLGNGTFDRDDLINNTFTTYLYPSLGAVANGDPACAGAKGNCVLFDTTSAGQAPIVGGNCDATTKICNVTIAKIPGVANDQYLVHMVDIYDKSDISINTLQNDTFASLKTVKGQAVVDATGKAKNVLKRLQVRSPLSPPPSEANFALEGQNICKRFDTAPVNGDNPQGTRFDSLSAACNLSQ